MLPRFHVITDDSVLAAAGFLAKAQSVFEAGGARLAFHLRGHETTARRLFDLGQTLMRYATRAGVQFLVNDRIDIGLVLGAAGVQLGQRSLRPAAARKLIPGSIGVSVHSAEQAAAAEQDGADFLLLGAIFATATHPGALPGGLDLLRRCRQSVSLPIVAIGGITPHNVADVIHSGAHGVAAVSGIWNSPEPDQAVRLYLEALMQAAG
jgi:thiamine-phosphate diphosphorylase